MNAQSISCLLVLSYLLVTGVSADSGSDNDDGQNTQQNRETGVSLIVLDIGHLDTQVIKSNDETVSWRLINTTSAYLSTDRRSGELSLSASNKGTVGTISLNQLHLLTNNLNENTTTLQIGGLLILGDLVLSGSGCDENSCDRPQLEIRVPEKTSLSFIRYSGQAEIQTDLEYLKFNGSGSLEGQSVNHLEIELSGNGRLGLADINGVLKARLRGNSGLNVGRSSISDGQFSISGNSTIAVKGIVDELSVKASGNATIVLGNVGTIQSRSLKGNASICISGSASTLASCL